jgi:hypothetical protein
MRSPVPAPFTWHLLGALVDNDVFGSETYAQGNGCHAVQVRPIAVKQGFDSAGWRFEPVRVHPQRQGLQMKPSGPVTFLFTNSSLILLDQRIGEKCSQPDNCPEIRRNPATLMIFRKHISRTSTSSPASRYISDVPEGRGYRFSIGSAQGGKIDLQEAHADPEQFIERLRTDEIYCLWLVPQ